MWRNSFLFVSLASLLHYIAFAQVQTQQSADQTSAQSDRLQPSSPPVTSVRQAIDRIVAREHDEVATIRRFNPIIEIYIQDLKSDKDSGSVPARDHYFVGQADLSQDVIHNFMPTKGKARVDALNPISHLTGNFSSFYAPDRFLEMIYIDTNGFDRQHYQFDYVRMEFLGDVKCAVFDITPLPDSGRGRFKGRVWAENQDYTIVRFNGVYTPVTGINRYELHFDSWRLNLQPGLWLPAFVFSQESDLRDIGGHVRFKSQTRLWGYDLKNVSHKTEFSEHTVESPTAIQDQVQAQQQDRSLSDAEREWQHQAEINVLDRLQRSGLLAPPGEVDKVLETVVNNLEVTNNLDIEPEVHCRVLVTGTLESFSIGHTIVLSRGLLDALPDEASLATMLARELASIIVTKPATTTRWDFNDTTNVSTVEALSHFSFQDNPAQVQEASEKAVELLKNSPYKDKLGNAELFLKQLDTESKSLSALINPRLGSKAILAAQLSGSARQLQQDKIDQIAALPIGARIKLDPWSDRVELLKPKPVTLYSARENMPFEVTPFIPFLTFYGKPEKPGPEGATPGKSAKTTQPQ